MTLYAITCNFQVTQNEAMVEGIAICSDPDTPITFIHPDGKPYTGDDIWDYRLKHFNPWLRILD